MRLDADTVKRFPALHYYVRIDMPKVVYVKAIIAAIKSLAGTTSRETIMEALKYGKGPLITVVPNLMCAGKKAFGCYKWGGDVLRVDEDLVKDFEAGRGVVKNTRGQRVFLLGATLLHELTHWADAQDATDDPVPGDPSSEEGDAYEKAVYGKALIEPGAHAGPGPGACRERRHRVRPVAPKSAPRSLLRRHRRDLRPRSGNQGRAQHGHGHRR